MGLTAKLCLLLTLVTVIARTRVTLLPGWTVPLPALIVAVEVLACATAVAVLISRTVRPGPALAGPAPGAPS